MTVPQRPPRWFSADDILTGRVSLDTYPLRFIWVNATPSSGFGITVASARFAVEQVEQVFSACELLETRGWQVVSFEQNGRVAYLRRLPRQG